MKQRIAFFLLVGLTLLSAPTVSLMANPVGKDEARQKALSFIGERRPAMARGAQLDLTLVLTNESYHVFNLGSEDGFVIVSGDDCTDDILGYSDSGTFEVQDMPENLRAWLQGYADKIAWMRANGVTAADNEAGSRSNTNKAPRVQIGPMLSTRWGQGDPYNLMTPVKEGVHCVTGCVATAMAQTMYFYYRYWGYQTQLVKDIPYIKYGYLSAPKSFDWSSMTDKYNSESTSDEKNAVAELMKYCGYSVEMDYGVSESGAYQKSVSGALTNHFGYQSAQYFERNNYSYDDWQDLIYWELYFRRPVILGVGVYDDGHSFVCDGYQKDDYFHFNWGWNGNHDGYFKLEICKPYEKKSRYYISEDAICCIHPTQTVTPSVEPTESVGTASASNLEVKNVDIPTLYYNETPDITLTIRNKNKNKAFDNNILVELRDKDNAVDIGAVMAYIAPNSTGTITIPVTLSLLPPGEYRLKVVCYRYSRQFDKLYETTVTVNNALPELKGGVEINESYGEPGKALTYSLTGDLQTLYSSHHAQWKITDATSDIWEDIPGATGTSYTPQNGDVGKYVRVDVSVPGYHGSKQSGKREVYKFKPMLEGTVTYMEDHTWPGDRLTCQFSGKVASIDASLIQVRWQRSSEINAGWVDIAGENGKSYVLKPSDVGYYIRVKITATGYDGMLYGPFRKCVKRDCTQAVVYAELENNSYYNKICVTNPVVTQEYIILDKMKETNELTESDWINAKTPETSNHSMPLGGTVNATNYVYTRVKETDTTLPSSKVCMSNIYFGENVYVQNFKLSLYKYSKVNGATRISALEEVEPNTYYVVQGDVIRMIAEPIPSNATNYNGIYYNRWINNSGNGSFYSDSECTKPLEEGQFYITVYYKPDRQENRVHLFVEYQKGYTDIVVHEAFLNVADSNGRWLVNNISQTIDVGKGETVNAEIRDMSPAKGTLYNMTTTLRSGSGTPPVLTFDETSGTVKVDATNASKGTFNFNAFQNGNAVGYIKVNVTTPPVEELRLIPSELELDCGQSLKLTAQLFPVGAEEEIKWFSSNTSVATVTADGVVTVKDDAEVGGKATIKAVIPASANEETGAEPISATCELTVPGTAYPLYVAGHQVTTRNMNDLAEIVAELSEEAKARYDSGDMIISFQDNMLLLKDVIIDVTGKTAQGMTLGMEDMLVMVYGDCRIKSDYSGIKVKNNVTLQGSGSLSLEGGQNGILFEGWEADKYGENACLTVDNVTLTVTGQERGVQGGGRLENHTMLIDKAFVHISSPGGATDGLNGLALKDCYIKEPENSKVYRDGRIRTSDGTPATDVVIFPLVRGDVNGDGKVDVADIADVIDVMAGEATGE